jgi:flagellar biosynthesis/type III secretory pathway protein FliH
MTQDQYGQARGPGYVVRGDVVPEDETEDTRTGEPKPMTRFQKVASALRGGSEADEQDQAAADRVSTDRTAADGRAADAPADSESGPPWVTRQDEEAMAGSPISRESAAKHDYWDDANAAGHENAVAVTSPDTSADHQATEPDMFGTTRRTGEETAEMPAATAERQPGAATIADVPAARTPVTETTASETPAGETPTPAAGGELRPGDATANLGDFSDLTYGNLVPDAEQFAAQWQQIQFRFVDDPHGSVTEAADVIAQVTAKMEAAIQERQRAIEERQRAIAEQQRTLRDRWGEGSNADTEALRATLRMYKTFLDQLIGPRAG